MYRVSGIWMYVNLSTQLSNEVFEITKTFPKAETYSLTDQIRRSSRSIEAQIAEAWGKRRYQKHFVSKLTPIAIGTDAEQFETQHWIITALECSYITAETAVILSDKWLSLGRMLNEMIEKAPTFCDKS